MNQPTVIIVGADKGGVGKTFVCRTLNDWLKANAIEYKAYDTQQPDGGLKKFDIEKTTVVNLEDSDDQVKVFDGLSPNVVTVIDIQAGLLSKTLTLLSEIGFIDLAKQGKLRVIVLHVFGPSEQSLSELGPVLTALQGSRHVAIANHINDTKYTAPAGAVDFPKLDELAAKAVDASSLLFSEYVNVNAGKVLGGKVRHWLGRVFAQFNVVLGDLK